ncbi:hypothetical protein DFH11DRAFT_730346 [Phellopilus nigrolimitatus]|nr:hypothetical protein DFH11DRAFT_939551 [Phellopilus nigrolimitatus]KAH8110968.1 hypothetical protein DFH11DRAFT_730346 [Phellopilus nigrolimitatus]
MLVGQATTTCPVFLFFPFLYFIHFAATTGDIKHFTLRVPSSQFALQSQLLSFEHKAPTASWTGTTILSLAFGAQGLLCFASAW